MPAKPRIVIVDVRNGNVFADGSNIDRPEEGREPALRSIETADVLVEISADNVFVKEGATKGWVLLMRTKSESQMNAEKAARELANRDKPNDDLEKGDHPVTQKFARIWDGSIKSGGNQDLKGF
jgi:hypothetical protein